MANEIPVFPEVGSRIVQCGRSRPCFSASTTIANAARSLMDPVGLRSSSLAQSRTSGEGDRRGSPTSGVPPMESSSESNLIRRALPAGDGGQDHDDVTVADGCREPAEEP